MNTHPIFRNYQSRTLYAIIWIFITSIQIIVTCSTFGLSFGYSLSDSLVFNTLFSASIFVLWYPVYYIRWKDQSRYYSSIFHVILATLLAFVCTGLSYLILYNLIPNNAYRLFLYFSFWWKIIEGFIFYIIGVLIYYLFLYIDRLNEKAANEIRLNQLLKDGELNLLKSQINPHFLFNSLNSLNSLIIKSPGQAQEMLVALSDYLRHTVMSTREEQLSLEDEVKNIKRYLAIEKLRFGEKLHYSFDIGSDCPTLKIPSILLQPLYENAVKHGVYESTKKVEIQTKIEKEGNFLKIEISNNFDSENPSPKKGSGTGLVYVRERLQLSYGNNAMLQTKSEKGTFIAVLKIMINNLLNNKL